MRMEYRPTRDCERRVGEYADQADDARARGKTGEAEKFLLLAWAAYDGQDGELEQDEPAPPQQAEVRAIRGPGR